MKKKALIALGFLFLLMMPSGAWYISNLPSDTSERVQSNVSDSQTQQVENEDADPDENILSSSTEEPQESFDQDIQEAVADVILESRQLSSHADLNMVAIGDSLTQGVGDSSDNGGYVGILEKSMENNVPDSSFHIKNYGKRGNRTVQLLDRLDNPNISASLEKADTILVTIGANDIMRILKSNVTDLTYEDFTAESDDYEDTLEEIFQTIREKNEEASIYLIGIYNPFNMYFSNIPELDQIITDWNNIGRDVVEQNDNATFIPIYDLFQHVDESFYSDDNFHPSQRGYASIANRILDYIEPEESAADEGNQND
ncbi:hypothetical protein D7Z54_26545 [Salibacterium salarium]|uniref:SGNH hydrolase-type esterase domain-containing protein n=1 Tax=Salibacterium salarium TaxID=284579 RepID=A0A428MW67_9BACI|nr:SGNH/GDSL hydrolase family protein [Salibacterium salarium]RSL30279.1 hypothetical protein D7Z54_26545 [Salibacterium salarium]